MPWTTSILFTVLFSGICGNRVMDNRLLRYSPAADPFNSANENSEFLETLSKFKSDLKSQSDGKLLERSPGTDDELNYQHELRNRNCNNNNFQDFMKNSRNSDGDEKITVDTIPRFNDLQMYGNSKTTEGVYDGDALIGGINDMNLLNSMLATLPVSNYKDFYTDLVLDSSVSKELGNKRNGNSIGSSIGSAPARGCDCKVKNDLVDLGQQHFPRYLLNAVCHTHDGRNSDLPQKCWSGSMCRPLEYKVKVLTFRTLMDTMQKDPTLTWLPDDLRPIWKFKTVTVTAGCFCS